MVRTKDPESKRKAILDAAASEMAVLGFAGANTAEIAAKAGVGVGTVFRLFATKQELANKVLQRALDRYEATLDPDFFTTKSARLQFKYLFQMLVKMYDLHPDDFIFMELHFVGSFIDEHSHSRRQAIRDRTDQWIKAQMAAGILRPGPPEVLRALAVGSFTRLIRESRDTKLRITNKALDFLEDSIWQSAVSSAES